MVTVFSRRKLLKGPGTAQILGQQETGTRRLAHIGYHASHEQFAPRELLRYIRMAQDAGFVAGMCSDHWSPWSEAQGHSSFAWSWLGAALEATNMPFGVVTVPGGWRYHPALLAQAAATLAQMYPGRLWLAPGSGEWLNEHITGGSWPDKATRNERLYEGVQIMRALWNGETVSREGPIPTDEARLWTLPHAPPQLIGAALTPKTARWLGGWADGLITVNQPEEALQEVIDAFREGGGTQKPVYLQVHLSYASTEAEAWRNAHEQWRTSVFDSNVLAQLKLTEEFEAAAKYVTQEEMSPSVRISADTEQHVAWLTEAIEMGINALFLHNVGRNQEEFIDVYGDKVLPRVAGQDAGGGKYEHP